MCRRLATMHNTMCVKSQAQHICTNASYQLSSTVEGGWWFGHIVILLCIPKYFRVKCKDICLTAKVWWKLGHSTRRWSQTQQQIHNRMAEKEKDQGVAIVYLKSTPEAEWNVKMLWWDCSSVVKKSGLKFLQKNVRLKKSYRKRLLQLITLKLVL